MRRVDTRSRSLVISKGVFNRFDTLRCSEYHGFTRCILCARGSALFFPRFSVFGIQLRPSRGVDIKDSAAYFFLLSSSTYYCESPHPEILTNSSMFTLACSSSNTNLKAILAVAKSMGPTTRALKTSISRKPPT